MSFCQVVLKTSLVDSVANAKEGDPKHPDWYAKVQLHKKKAPNDPLPFPFNDPDPQCYFPLSEDFPWHTQIHRDAFGYGEVPPTIDQRLVVDFRWFTYVKPVYTNYVEFSSKCKDEFGMPQVRKNSRWSALRETTADTALPCSQHSISEWTRRIQTAPWIWSRSESNLVMYFSAHTNLDPF